MHPSAQQEVVVRRTVRCTRKMRQVRLLPQAFQRSTSLGWGLTRVKLVECCPRKACMSMKVTTALENGERRGRSIPMPANNGRAAEEALLEGWGELLGGGVRSSPWDAQTTATSSAAQEAAQSLGRTSEQVLAYRALMMVCSEEAARQMEHGQLTCPRFTFLCCCAQPVTARGAMLACNCLDKPLTYPGPPPRFCLA